MTTILPDRLADLLKGLPQGDEASARAVAARQARLTKPAGSLGMLEEGVAWLARWQGRAVPRLDQMEVVIFAGNHGVVAQGVSPFPAAVTAQMVANFEAGGAAINQISGQAGAALAVHPLSLDTPTADFTLAPAMTEAEFRDALAAGFAAVTPGRNGHRQYDGGGSSVGGAFRRRWRRLGWTRHGPRPGRREPQSDGGG
jgi:nicotinate-nucleotide--dimethylbenzimidazole phosphoribosyltransferase